MDSNEIFVGEVLSKEDQRDVIKLWKEKDTQAILALEAQGQIDFTMVSRTLLYDALTYNMQDKESKNYKILPVVSLVLFHGEGKWTAASSLMERMDIPENLKRIPNDWKMKIVDIKDLDYHLLGNEDNRNVVKAVRKIWKDQSDNLKGFFVTKTVARVIAILTGKEEILDQIKGDEGTVAMWSFWQDIEDSGFQKGKMETLKMMLTNLFGKLTPELTLKIELSNEEKLNNLTLHISDIHSEADVYKILE